MYSLADRSTIPLTGWSTLIQERNAHVSDNPTTTGPLTVVLVHGAFADASSWNGVIERLQKAGVQVTAPANPLRGIASDSAYLASCPQPDSRPGAGRRPLVRGRGDQQRRHQSQQRRRPGLCRRLRPRGRGAAGRGRKRLKGQHPGHRPGPAQISDGPGSRDRRGVRGQSGALP